VSSPSTLDGQHARADPAWRTRVEELCEWPVGVFDGLA
jgi:hypothetical protein